MVTDGSAQMHRHNAPNEITVIPEAVIPTYDATGYLTRDRTEAVCLRRLGPASGGEGCFDTALTSYAYDGRAGGFRR
jgi:hypothetical protein